jgi:hypothetical protein
MMASLPKFFLNSRISDSPEAMRVSIVVAVIILVPQGDSVSARYYFFLAQRRRGAENGILGNEVRFVGRSGQGEDLG